MTGFGAAQAELRLGRGSIGVRVEARSVNHRFLQVKTRLPGELSFLEPAIDERVRRCLGRGSVTVAVALGRAAAFEEVAVDVELAREWRRRLTAAARELGVEWEADLEGLIALPGVLGGRVDEGRLRKGGRAVLKAVGEALSSLVEMREHEGARLEAELRRLVRAVGRTRARIARRVPGVLKRHQAALRERAEALLEGRAVVSDGDVARELALLADRLDVGEELARLESHEAHLVALLDAGGALGRKLDFLVQELYREANTVGSKASDAGVAHLVVELKSSIERLREQVQNIE